MRLPDLSWLVVRPDPLPSSSPNVGGLNASRSIDGAATAEVPRRDSPSTSSLRTPFDEETQSKDVVALVGSGQEADVVEHGAHDRLPQHDELSTAAVSLSKNDMARRSRASARWHPPRGEPVEPLIDHTNRQYMPVYLWRDVQILRSDASFGSASLFPANVAHNTAGEGRKAPCSLHSPFAVSLDPVALSPWVVAGYCLPYTSGMVQCRLRPNNGVD